MTSSGCLGSSSPHCFDQDSPLQLPDRNGHCKGARRWPVGYLNHTRLSKGRVTRPINRPRALLKQGGSTELFAEANSLSPQRPSSSSSLLCFYCVLLLGKTTMRNNESSEVVCDDRACLIKTVEHGWVSGVAKHGSTSPLLRQAFSVET